MAESAEIGIYVINLDRSEQRLAQIGANLAQHGFDFTRVSAVDGRLLPPDAPIPLDRDIFKRDNGRDVLPGEIGCFMSHLNVLAALRDSSHSFGVILEDDGLVNDQFRPTLEGLTKVEGWDLVKLVNNRTKMFKAAYTLENGVEIGRCLHGPSGSSAAYIVRRSSAQALIDGLSPMRGPYDVELEAGWRTGMEVYCTGVPVVDLGRSVEATVIGGRNTYREARYPWWRRLGTLRFRNREIVARTAYFAKI
jgi:glycosyl transferase family 25